MPEEKVAVKKPVIHSRVKSCQVRRRPMRSVTAMAMAAPIAAPSTPSEVMTARRLASSDGDPVHRPLTRLKSLKNDSSPEAAAKPPSS